MARAGGAAALQVAARSDLTPARRAAGERDAAGGPAHSYSLFCFIIIFKLIRISTNQKWSSVALKFSNKIWECIYWNKEQILSLEFFKIRNGIWIKILRTKLSQIWLILNSID
jgi:hypothetical protein